jgi:small subunit ribosomal protein S1
MRMPEPSESLEDLLAQEDGVGAPRRGDLLRGVVIERGARGLVIDLGLKRDGVAPPADLSRLPNGETSLKVGDAVAVMVVDPEDNEGNLIVSVSQARESGDWLEAQRLMEQDAVLEAAPSGFNRGGLIVPFGRLRGFAPASHLTDLPRGREEDARTAALEKMVGHKMPFKVIEVDPQRQRLVLSERKAIRQWRQEQKTRVITSLREGDVRKGVVTSLREFGAFVDIGGADGLIHISELAWHRVEDPGQILRVGQEVEAIVVRLDHQAHRIGLSLTRMQPNPWKAAEGSVHVGDVLPALVVRHTAGGPIVRLENGLEGPLRGADGGSPFDEGSQLAVRVRLFEPEREHLEVEVPAESASQTAGVGGDG